MVPAEQVHLIAERLREREGYFDVDSNSPIEWWEELVERVLQTATEVASEAQRKAPSPLPGEQW